MAFKLIEAAEQRWRRVNAPLLVTAVLHDVKLKVGVRIKPDQATPSADQEPELVAA